MLANSRSRFFSSMSFFSMFLAAAFSLSAALATAQVNGVPASVTSFGFGGSNNPAPGVRASVTSLGPNGYGSAFSFLGNCCPTFLPSGRRQPVPPLRADHREHHRHDLTYVPFAVPAFIPYGVSYGEPYTADTDDADDDSYAYASDLGQAKPSPGKRLPRRPPVDSEPSPKATEPEQREEPVATQPATVLVFKDGRRFDVVNYAIIGTTLFQFDEGRTHKILLADLDLPATEKANDDRGVDFKIPAAAK